jgi:hypothetical protein
MSDEGRGSGSTADSPVTLEFLARQGRRVLDELATLRDGMNVLMEIVLRHEREFERLNGKLDDMLRQMTVMVTQQQRFGDRLLSLDERVHALENRQASP